MVSADEFIQASELRRGMILKGYTRMDGNEMVEFELEIIGFGDKKFPRYRAIWAEIKTALFKEFGVSAGMSGSPVYYQGKLVGAVAYTMDFLKKPICGITPIHSMLHIIDYFKTNRQKPPPYEESEQFYKLTPIAVPFSVSGPLYLDSDELEKILGKNSIVWVTGQNLSDGSDANEHEKQGTPFVPGDACAVNLLSGDLTINAVGTVTYVSNDYVLAFGHPFYGGGKVRMPLHKASVDFVMPKLDLSFKVASTGREVGVLVEDRGTGVLGVIGEERDAKIPIVIEMNTPINNKIFNYAATSDRFFFPQIAILVIQNTISGYESLFEEATISYKFKVDTDYQGRSVEIADQLSRPHIDASIFSLVEEIDFILRQIRNNPFVPINITGIQAKIYLDNSQRYLSIVDMRLRKLHFSPGETIEVDILFEGYRKSRKREAFMFDLPVGLEPGKYSLVVSSESEFINSDRRINPNKYLAGHPSRIFEILNSSKNSRSVSIYFYDRKAQGMVVDKTTYSHLPGHIADNIGRSRSLMRAKLRDAYKKDYPVSEWVRGSAIVTIEVVEGK